LGIYTSSIRGRVSPFASAVYPHYKGIVKWFNNAKGYGFLGHDGGADVFVHYSSIKREGYKTLKEGDPVEFGAFSHGNRENHEELRTRNARNSIAVAKDL